MMQVKPLERSVEQDVRITAMAFLDGEQSFQWVTSALSQSGLPKEATHLAIRHLRNYGDPYRAEALFAWLNQSEW
jgi:hypothetical protein